MNGHGKCYALMAVLAICSAAGTSYAQQAPISREEFDKVMKELTELRQEVAGLKQERATATSQPAGAAAGSSEIAQLRQEVATLKKQRVEDLADAEERQGEVDKIVKDVLAASRAHSLGETKLLITGDASVGFIAQRNNTNSFSAGVAPRFLWKINDHLQFDAAMDIGLGRDSTGANSTDFSLEIASITYILNDYLVIGGGKFVAPFGAYHRNFDPAWINKLPDDPLVFSDNGLGPASVLGIFVSGGYPIASTKITYALYASNGPELATSDAATAGSLVFDNHTDLNNNKAVGGRIGFLPIPELEMGYSFLCGQASPSNPNNPNNFPDTNAFVQAVDLNYTRQSEKLGGTISLHAEWIWSHVGDATYFQAPDSTGAGGFGPLTFNNNRNGGYAQFAYRPTLSSYKILRNFEGIFRYDRLDGPSLAPAGAGREQRYTFGLDYWLDARSVVKFAYECDDIANAAGSPAYMFQYGLGF